MEHPGRFEDRIGLVVRRVLVQSGGRLPVEVIEDRVRAEFARWDEVALDAYVPIFVERRVADALGISPTSKRRIVARARARADQAMTAERTR